MTSYLPEQVPPAARERVVEQLSRLFTNDELTEEAFESYLQRLYAATTLQEINAIVASLPIVPSADAPAVAIAVRALFSGQGRKVVTTVPRELTLRSWFGYVELDLTDATFEPGITTIDVGAFMGYVQIRLPPGLRVENAGRAVFGFFALRDAVQGVNSTSVVRITGRAWFGFAEGLVSKLPELE